MGFSFFLWLWITNETLMITIPLFPQRVTLFSLCHLQLPESVLRVSGRRERHHGRDQREADWVSLLCSFLDAILFPSAESLCWRSFRGKATCRIWTRSSVQVQLCVWDLLSVGQDVLHRFPQVLQTGTDLPRGSSTVHCLKLLKGC